MKYNKTNSFVPEDPFVIAIMIGLTIAAAVKDDKHEAKIEMKARRATLIKINFVLERSGVTYMENRSRMPETVIASLSAKPPPRRVSVNHLLLLYSDTDKTPEP
jgi:hypothetical protein